jgi:hypothetical protein
MFSQGIDVSAERAVQKPDTNTGLYLFKGNGFI